MIKRKSDIKLIIFDLDGTLINTDLYVILNHVHLSDHFYHEARFDLNTLIEFSGPSLTESYNKYYSDIPYDDFMKEFMSFSDKYSNYYSRLYPDEVEVLSNLKKAGYKLAIFTSKRRHAAEINLSYFDIKKYFDYILCLEDIEKPKPSGEGILKLIDTLHLSKEEVCMIGDSAFDYLAAKYANVKSIMCTWGLRRLPDFVKPYKFIKNYKDLEEEFIINE